MVRVKRRYLLCEVNVSKRSHLLQLDDRAVAAAVRAAVARTHGDYGAAHCLVGFSVKYLNAHTGMVFLRFPKKCYKLLWSALPFITSIEVRGQNIPCFLNCVHVGGTIRTCQKFLIRYNTQQLHRMLPKCKDEEEKQQVREAILQCSLPGGKKEAFEDKLESDEDEEE
ncbi:ribonuclease P/MRP protein subunit POP5 [Hippoglossus hippoglossus]|uniref:ribonuclease P/MRP protein subunit POP5 n=1 Tax=Hippoglossus hippoglossus TaxID=8267 RepID=UPI00148D1E25|nr:ribonuclease P/MRP protein subunit POP5 [Hippoglossus hippoglossus]XP_035021713.1 ribonuclease P/MRP protein subunit POP5 [Hippoglossus stenolepis]